MKQQLFLIISFFVFTNSFSQQSKLVSGPWAGNVGLRTATIWAEVTNDTKKITIKYFAHNNTKNVITKYYTNGLGKDFNPVKIELNALEPNTIYTYNLWLDDKEVKTTFTTNFTTKDLWQWRKPAPDFSFLAGSCAYFNEPIYDRPGKPYGDDSSIFEIMATVPAAFHLWMGDNWYTREVDYESVWGLNYRASHDRSYKVLQKFMAAMPQYAIWDDHDYGPNDAGKNYIYKDESRQIFKNYSANPSYGENGKGIYTLVNYGDVDLFLTDNRYFRSNDRIADSIDGKPNADKHFFGPMQMEWLKNSLLFSNATFKIIVVGSQVMNPLNDLETMQKYSYEYYDLLNFIKQQKIRGVIFFTGDRHHSAVTKVEQQGFYPLYDVTISSYTAGISKPSGDEKDSPFRVNGTLVEEHNFGKISVSGDKKNRVLKVDFINTKGQQLGTWSVNSNELK
ncbi:MAG: alkaline phosphatase D family protein [Ferruginibacter sp.]|nr:alkaline phosphatase family protein [Ferruginibacter sp.]